MLCAFFFCFPPFQPFFYFNLYTLAIPDLEPVTSNRPSDEMALLVMPCAATSVSLICITGFVELISHTLTKLYSIFLSDPVDTNQSPDGANVNDPTSSCALQKRVDVNVCNSNDQIVPFFKPIMASLWAGLTAIAVTGAGKLMLCEVTASDDTERAACRDAPEPEPDADAGR